MVAFVQGFHFFPPGSMCSDFVAISAKTITGKMQEGMMANFDVVDRRLRGALTGVEAFMERRSNRIDRTIFVDPNDNGVLEVVIQAIRDTTAIAPRCL